MSDIKSQSSVQYHYDHSRLQSPYDHRSWFSRHSHNTYELLFFEEGDATYVIEDKKYKLNPNDLVITRPGQYHYIDLHSNAPYSRISVTFDAEFVGKELLCSIPDEIEIVNCPKKSIIAENLSRIDYYRDNLGEEDFCVVLSSLLREIFYNVKLSSESASTPPQETSQLLKSALEYINANLFDIKSVDEISRALFITDAYFFKIFKNQLRISPKKYINTKRLLHAQKLLRLGKKPTDIYSECGFESYVGFYKQYVKQFGYPPSLEENPHSPSLKRLNA